MCKIYKILYYVKNIRENILVRINFEEAELIIKSKYEVNGIFRQIL